MLIFILIVLMGCLMEAARMEVTTMTQEDDCQVAAGVQVEQDFVA